MYDNPNGGYQPMSADDMMDPSQNMYSQDTIDHHSTWFDEPDPTDDDFARALFDGDNDWEDGSLGDRSKEHEYLEDMRDLLEHNERNEYDAREAENKNFLIDGLTDLPDDYEIPYGDGFVKKGDLFSAYEIKQQSSNFLSQYESFTKGINDRLTQANALLSNSMSETDRSIRDLEAQLKNTPAGDYMRRGIIGEKLDAAYGRKAVLEQDTTKLVNEFNAMKAEAQSQRINSVDHEMRQVYRDWDTVQAPAIIGFVKESGLDTSLLLDHSSPQLMEIFKDAMAHRKYKAETRKAVQEAPQQRKRSASSQSRGNASSYSNQHVEKRNNAARKMQSGQFDDTDLSNMFDFLED